MHNLPPIDINPETFLREHFSLPALPKVVHEIQEIIQSDNVEIGKVSKLISGDPSLVAQLLKVVNSAYYSLPREITEVRYAIAFLGLHEVYRMVLALSVINTLAITERDELEKFWFHSFYASLCTKHLANRYEPQLSFEELWSAAILHDIGKLVYLKFFPDHYKTLRTYMDESGGLFSEAEEQFSFPRSSYLGTLLCDHWRLPAKVKDACEIHTLKDLQNLQGAKPAESFRRMICLGNLAAVLAANRLGSDKKPEIAKAFTTALGSSESDFLALMAEIYDLRIEVDRFMDQFR